MAYQVLARKWRPQTFEQIVGQEHVTTTLANALSRGRVAHAYLFTGPRGCGKTTMARLMAKALNCDEGPTATPCGKCPSCDSIARGNQLDVLEIDAASNTGVDNIRELRENAQYQPSAGKKRVFIIDEVHMLSKGAFNALLKTLEEPPDHVHFIFATTEPVKIPRTILSRCQRFDFRLFTLAELSERLRTITSSEKVDIADDAIEMLASLAEGSMRDALSLLDQAIASTEGTLDAAGVLQLYGLVGHEPYLDLNQAILERDPRKALDLIDDLVRGGHDLVEFARGIVANFRDLTLLRLDPSLAERVDKPEAIKKTLAEQAQGLPVADWVYLAERSAEHYSALERAPQPRWLMETQVVEYATLESRVLLSEVLARLDGAPAPVRSAGSAAVESAPAARPESAPGRRSSPAEAATPPRSAAEPATPAGSGAGTGDSDAPTVTGDATWQRFVAAVRSKEIALATLLAEAAPQLGDDRLTLVFPPECTFQRQQVARRETLAKLAAIAAEVYGRPLELHAASRDHLDDESTLQKTTKEEVTPDAEQKLARHAKQNPNLGSLLEGLGGAASDDA